MPVLTPDLLYLTADEILSCVCEALSLESVCGCPCRIYVSAGPPAWDDCCEGQLTAWIENIFYHENFPARQTTPAICGSMLGGDLVIQLLRCAPTVADDGSPPPGPVLDESARLLYQDMYIALNAATCCLAEARRHREYLIRDTRVIGPQGGCVGFELRLTIQLHDPLPGTV